MSNVQIPNLPAGTSLNGNEELEAVQSGSSVRITTDQIAQYGQSQYPAPGVTSIATSSPITGGVITTTGTIGLENAAVTNSYLANMAAGTVKANVTGGSTTPQDVTPTEVLDLIGTTRGSLLYRGASEWDVLTSGTSGQVLTAVGPTSDPVWQDISVDPGSLTPTGVSPGTYGSASAVGRFTVLSSGQLDYANDISIQIPNTQVTGLGTMSTQNANAVVIVGGSVNGTIIGPTTPDAGYFTTLTSTSTTNLGTINSGTWNATTIAVAKGGTGATTASGARSNLSAAVSGANSDITSLSGLTTPLSAPQGGTGFSSFTTGDVIYANTATTLARLNDVGTGNVLLSGGVGVAPAYGKVALTTHVSGTLPVANGGTGATTLTGYVKGDGTNPFTANATIPNADLDNDSITIGSTTLALGDSTLTLAGLDSVTLTQDPSADLEAATKQYVDNEVATVSNTTFHEEVQASTTANLTANYNNGTGGVGATLTNSGAQAAFEVDGYAASQYDRILVRNQTNAYENGIYEVTTVGSGASNWVLTRTTDFDATGSGPNKIETGASVFVQGGDDWGSTSWVMVTTGTINVGSTSLVWVQTSSSGNILVTSPLSKSGNTISLNTVPATVGGTGQTSYTAGDLLYADSGTSLAKLSDIATGNVLLSGGVATAPAYGKVGLTSHVDGTLPVTNGGTGTATQFTAGSVVFAGASGVYSQSNGELFFDNVNGFLGVGTALPDTEVTIVSTTQAAIPGGTLPAGTDLHIVGADNAVTRITQDAFGTGNYAAYTGRSARGTAASPTASQAGDILVELTARGYGTSDFSTSSIARIDLEAAENFTNTAQGTYISLHTSALGAASAVERFRVGPSGQLGIGGATYGTANYVLTSGGSGAAPTWSQVSLSAGVTGILPAANGGTGQSSYTTGDLLYADSATSLAKLADIATGNVLISGGVGVAPAYGKVGLTTHVSGTLPVANGGTGQASNLTQYGLVYGSTTTVMATTAAGTDGQFLVANTGAAPSWSNATDIAVTSISFGTTGLTPNSATKGAVTVAGTLVAANGGTGQSSYAVGDILYASTTTALSALADVATGNVLLSGGVGVAPAYGKVGLTTHISGTLPVANGGTGQASNLTQYGVVYGSTTTAMATTGAGTTGQVLTATTSAAPAWAAQTGGVTWSAISGNTNAVAGTGYMIDTTSTAVTLTLPASPAVGDYIAVCDAASKFGTNNLTVARNTKVIQGSATDLTCSINDQSFGLVYQGATNGWRIVQT
jgi:hypothetical protein